MKVFFGTTTTELITYYKEYKSIRDYLVQKGCVVLYDWLDDAYSSIKESGYNRKRNVKKIYEKVIKAIDEADFNVIEYTVPNFSSSHQITYSIQKRKPTLVMRKYKDNKYFAGSYIEAIDSPFLSLKEYNIENYKNIIDEFIGYSEIEKGMKRYNIVLDYKQKYFLDWAASYYKKSRSEIIRESLEKEMQNDNNYSNYINKI